MANGGNQQESLEVLKLINAASTAIRLYPADSSQACAATEKAYQGIKSFLRKHKQLHFSCHNGVCQLGGIAVDKPVQERLQLLTFHDFLQKMGLRELVLGGNVGRRTFKKILSVFSATPEQVHKVGGSRALIEQLQLGKVFPEENSLVNESREEQVRRQKVDSVLAELTGGKVQPDDLHYLYGKQKGDKFKARLCRKFQTAKGASRYIATACYSLLQILQKEKTVSVAPVFTTLIERTGALIQAAGSDRYDVYAREAVLLLVPKLAESSVMILICQHYPEPFGPAFYDAIIKIVDTGCLSRVYRWMERQHEKCVAAPDGGTAQMRVVCIAYERFQNTSRAKQLVAANHAREILVKTEEERKAKRVQAGIEALAAGNMEGLKNKEVCTSLPFTIANLLKHEKESLAAAIIQNVVSGLREKKSNFHDRFTQVMGGIAVQLVTLKRWDWLEKLTPVCLARIREIEEPDPGYRQLVQAMQDMMNHAWAAGNNDLAERILDIFYYIRSGALEKPDDLRQIIAEIQDKNVDLTLLQAYLDECFIRPVNEIICKKITMQGPVAARFLLDTLISTGERSDRIRLLKLLGEIGEGLVPVLLERLPDPMPWYGKRNIIRLLAVTGSEENVAVVLPYMSHEDLRVQQECLQCIIRLGKSAKCKYLLKILPDVTLRMKIQVVQNLGKVADASLVAPLATLLDDCKMYKGEDKNRLVDEICRTLGVSGSVKAIPVLQKIVDASGKEFGKGNHATALESISLLRTLKKTQVNPRRSLPLVRDETKKQPPRPQTATAMEQKTPAPAYEAVTDSVEEAEVYKLLAKDKLESAKKLLLLLIEKSARIRQFKQAEALRQRLVEIDSTALADIIKAAEYIENAKTAGVDEDHIIIWSELYDLLSTEEFDTFYQALVHEKYALEENIVKQGETQGRLFFVNKGRVKLYFQEKGTGSEILVRTLGSGKIFGGDSFFNDSVWTLSATSMGSVELSTLAVEKLDEWKETFPALEPTIQDYCKRVSSEQEFFLSTGANRRNEKRHECTIPLSMELLTEDGHSSDTVVTGMGIDISTGGLSFVSQIDRRKHARMLLGRRIQVLVEQTTESIELIGRVVAIRSLHLLEHGRSVHISFDKELDEASLSSLMD